MILQKYCYSVKNYIIPVVSSKNKQNNYNKITNKLQSTQLQFDSANNLVCFGQFPYEPIVMCFLIEKYF